MTQDVILTNQGLITKMYFQILREFEGVEKEFKCVRHVSFVDCPGHDVLMQTMLNGTAVMDAAILLVASNESCPQVTPQFSYA